MYAAQTAALLEVAECAPSCMQPRAAAAGAAWREAEAEWARLQKMADER